MNKFLLTCALFISPLILQAQVLLKANILDQDKEPIIGANVYDSISGINTTTDYKGDFELSLKDDKAVLQISLDGYQTVTKHFPQHFQNGGSIVLNRSQELDEVAIVKRRKATEISMFSVSKTEHMGLKELAKAACCNLSESFETSPSVDAGFTDAVSGYKQISMLGLSGPNVAFTRENIPDIRGLSSITGLTFTPGPWVQSIQLSKGTGSVVNGFEGVAGQINVELAKPHDEEQKKLLLNFYQSDQGRTEGNIVYNKEFKEHLYATFFGHAKNNWLSIDMNKDKFLDQPLGGTYLLGNRWIILTPKGMEYQFGWKLSKMDNFGGNVGYDPKEAFNGNVWGFHNDIFKTDIWAKIGKIYLDKPNKSMGLQLNGSIHNQESQYGRNLYTGKEKSFYLNYIFQNIIHNTNHLFKVGSSVSIDDYKESWNNRNYNRTEIVPGIFGEYTYNYLDKFSLVAGLRGDYNNIYGFFATPRLHVRYSPKEDLSIRASIGRAQRTANVLTENLGFMASNRNLEIIPAKSDAGYAYGLAPEVAWNMGVNATKKFVLNYRDGSISMDYYYTHFQNMILADVENFEKLSIYNIKDNSFAHSFQVQLDYEILRKWDTRIAYRFYDVRSEYNDGVERQKPLLAQNRFFVNTAYETKNGWNFDLTANWTGKSRMPQHYDFENDMIVSSHITQPFWIWNTQISKSWKFEKYKLYMGVENIFNKMQHHLILNADQPFEKGFDAGLVWGSAMGRNIYLGFNYLLR